MTNKQMVRKLETLKARQMKVRDQIREFAEEVEQHYENAQEAVDLLEEAADAVSRLV